VNTHYAHWLSLQLSPGAHGVEPGQHACAGAPHTSGEHVPPVQRSPAPHVFPAQHAAPLLPHVGAGTRHAPSLQARPGAHGCEPGQQLWPGAPHTSFAHVPPVQRSPAPHRLPVQHGSPSRSQLAVGSGLQC